MIRRLRLMIALVRPAVVVLLALFTATGLAQAGRGEDTVLLGKALLVVIGFLLFSVACNDLADEAIDRVNLAGDTRRPLVAGTGNRRELIVIGVTSALVALAASATLHWPAVMVTAAGLAVSANYSLGPVRFASRGALASMVLPACYVAVPYLLGIFAAGAVVHPADLLLLAGLYIGFIGRILLKDFRDVRGDALFGKRTFLVRHGRRWTCLFSASCWVAGALVVLAAVVRPTPALTVVYLACVAVALGLLRALAAQSRPRREEALIAGIAIVGRGMILALLAHLSTTHAVWPALGYYATMAALFVLTVVQAGAMVRRDPITRTTITFAEAPLRADVTS